MEEGRGREREGETVLFILLFILLDSDFVLQTYTMYLIFALKPGA